MSAKTVKTKSNTVDKWFKEVKSYNGKGTLNASAFPEQFVEICKMEQHELKGWLTIKLGNYYDNVIFEDGYIYVEGTDPVCLTAHMDTVHKELVKDFYGVEEKGKHIISSPQGIGGDDRCGVFMILNILETTELRPSIIFCEDEEIGGVGSNKFCKDFLDIKKVNFFIELDRANGNDLVFYDDENAEFQNWCESVTGYKTAWGSFSDISHLCPEYGFSGVNISCGYYNAHTKDEYIVLEEMMASIEAAKKLIIAGKELGKKFKYEYRTKYSYGGWYDDYDRNYSSYGNDLMVQVMFCYYDNDWNEMEEVVEAESQLSAIGKFLTDHPDICWGNVYDFDTIN